MQSIANKESIITKISNKVILILSIFLILISDICSGQVSTISTTDTVLYQLDPIIVTAMRFPVRQKSVPFSVALLDNIDIQYARQQLSLRESLVTVPGLFALNETNFAQDLRIAIRGFGARAAFGIRGIKVLIDGIPETTPDGQTQLDNLNLGIINRAEIIRGAVSALYGNASGGVISLSTQKPPPYPFFESRLAGGAYGYRSLQLTTGNDLGSWNYLISLAHNSTTGYRDHSKMSNYLFNGLINIQPDNESEITIRLTVEQSPLAEDPGSLTLEQIEANREQAYSNNIKYNAGEEVTQGRIGLFYRKQFNTQNGLTVQGHLVVRDFNNRLPFEPGGMVNLERKYTGIGLNYWYSGDIIGLKSYFVAGTEFLYQSDLRKRFNNLDGDQGDLSFDQDENFFSTGFFIQEEINVTSAWKAMFGLRFDQVNIEAVDNYLSNGDASGSQSFRGYSGMFGMNYSITTDLHLYGNISSGFETPALIELSNNPDQTGGLNPNLKPQESVNYEIGLKGQIADRFGYEITLFNIDVTDELVPYELPESPGRIYFRNAGHSRHRGLESGIQGFIGAGFSIALSYTFSDFFYLDYNTPAGNFAGNSLPGIPKHNFYGQISYIHPSGFFGRIELQNISSLYSNDANTFEANAYSRINVQTGYSIVLKQWELEPFVGLNNLLNARYSDNIRINAFGDRYYEPAPMFNLYIGITVNIGE